MIKFTNRIKINRPIDEVFTFVSDFENVPKWNYYVTQVTNLSNHELQKGTVYHQIRKSDQQKFEVLDYIPNQRVVVKTLPGSNPEFRIECLFEGDSQLTEFTYNWDLEFTNSGLGGIIDKLAKNKVKNAVRQNMSKLKQLLESGTVTLQDGRLSTYQV